MSTVYVSAEMFDDLVGLTVIRAQLDALEAERIAQAKVCLSMIEGLPDDGDRLKALHGFRVAFGSGWSKAAVAAGLPTPKQLEAKMRGRCNDGEGRWRGTFPLVETDVRPGAGTWVVYQLLLGDDLVYIGSTGAFANRIKAHARTKDFDGWRAAKCENEAACRALETALIDRHRPPLNRMIPTPKVALR